MTEDKDSQTLSGEIGLLKPNFKMRGEYGEALGRVWEDFVRVRTDKFYASESENWSPELSSRLLIHSQRGRFEGRHYKSPDWKFIPPENENIRSSCTIGIVSSDMTFEGDPRTFNSYEDETFGTADFFTLPDGEISMKRMVELLKNRSGGGIGFAPQIDERVESANLVYAFDMSRSGLAPLMQYAIRDDRIAENPIAAKFYKIMQFPARGSGQHIAVPVGLPANYIEFIVLNEKSPYWQGDRLEQLRRAAVCDGRGIPLISARTGEVISQ